ncbi:hypothetical protein Syun_010612 [Stephania yunnanensis]|uniref:4-hydroxy-4-methyl-2-oxoglutarate aldolase n=1 Tax=Stephania yunnanensis TaxID=152371 RepID=A0AAP0PPT0_9MAGN
MHVGGESPFSTGIRPRWEGNSPPSSSNGAGDGDNFIPIVEGGARVLTNCYNHISIHSLYATATKTQAHHVPQHQLRDGLLGDRGGLRHQPLAYNERRPASSPSDLPDVRSAKGVRGRVVTLKLFEDNVLVRQQLETKGEGRVLVIDGGGSMRCALLGGNLALLAQNMGWVGIVVNGCIRDVDEINGCDIGVRALASHPLKSYKKGTGEKHVSVHIGGVVISDGDWLYADSDGVLVSNTELSV